MLTSRSSTLCFGAGDLMPEAMQSAFYQGVLEYLQNPDQLHTILSQLDNVRKDTYTSHPSFTCGPA
jgi:alpha-glucoside transport system substrate-binding protein